MDLSSPIDIINYDDLTHLSFKNSYIKANKPAIIKGLLEHNPAGEKWTLDYLMEKLGDYDIKVFNNKKVNGTSFLIGETKIPLKNMFELVRKNESSEYRMFVNPVLNKEKTLKEDLSCPSFFKGPFQLPNLLFLGGKGCIVPLHFDFMKDDGLLTHFFGKKEVILIENNQSDYLYRLPLNTISLVNLFEPDYDTHKALQYVKGYRVTLHHGDTLYIPSGYWHQLKYVDASMSVAFRRWNTNPLITVITAAQRMVQIPVDKTLQAMLGGRWLEYKKKVTHRRVEKKTRRMNKILTT